MRGRIHQINVKPATPGEHGLPKWPVESVQITRAGLLGDFNLYRHEERHDDPDSAVLLMPLETLEQLNTEGWPVRPGDIGENFTIAGIPYGQLSPGRTFRLGTAEVQISRACKPCTNLYLLPYVGVARGPGFLKVMLDRRGWYARVLKEGRAKRGDAIEDLSPTQKATLRAEADSKSTRANSPMR